MRRGSASEAATIKFDATIFSTFFGAQYLRLTPLSHTKKPSTYIILTHKQENRHAHTQREQVHCKWCKFTLGNIKHTKRTANGTAHKMARFTLGHTRTVLQMAQATLKTERYTPAHTHTRKNLFLQRGLRISKLPSCSTNKNTDAQSSFVPWKSIIISPLAEFGSFLPTGEKKTGRNLEPGRKFKSLEAQSTYRWCSSKSFVFLKKYIMYCFPH